MGLLSAQHLHVHMITHLAVCWRFIYLESDTVWLPDALRLYGLQAAAGQSRPDKRSASGNKDQVRFVIAKQRNDCCSRNVLAR
ncbi:MAG: hypothetical protein KKC01_12330 [Gammaproteobacteria bacterium]|nr:hypothetical protein [Gammaproteobacteria bacterium]